MWGPRGREGLPCVTVLSVTSAWLTRRELFLEKAGTVIGLKTLMMDPSFPFQ